MDHEITDDCEFAAAVAKELRASASEGESDPAAALEMFKVSAVVLAGVWIESALSRIADALEKLADKPE